MNYTQQILGGVVSIAVLSVTLLGFYLLMLYIIQLGGIKDGNPAFVVKYLVLVACIVSGQCVMYLILRSVFK